MNIIPDLTLVLVQLAPFLVLMLGLHLILYKPMLAYLHERSHATEGPRKAAEKFSADATARLSVWETQMEKARQEIVDLRSARRAQANVAYQAVINTARKDAEQRVTSAVAVVRQEAARARADIAPAAALLAGDMTEQVLGRPSAEA